MVMRHGYYDSIGQSLYYMYIRLYVLEEYDCLDFRCKNGTR